MAGRRRARWLRPSVPCTIARTARQPTYKEGPMRKSLTLLSALLALTGTAAAQDPLAPPPPAPPPPPPPAMTSEGAAKESGFALQVNFGSRVLDIVGAGNSAVTLGEIQGGFFVGYKFGRVIAGMGFDILRIAGGTSTNGQDTSTAQTSILFIPGVTVAALRSADGRVELFGELDFGIGTTFNSQSPPPMGNQPSTSNVGIFYQIGPGLRFWATPNFAFGGMVGLAGDFQFNNTTQMTMQGNITSSTSSAVTAI